MPKMTIMKGLPASGKTTRAMELLKDGNTIRVNRAEIHKMLHGPDAKQSDARDARTLAAEYSIVLDGLEHGRSIVIDDCNLGHDDVYRWRTLAPRGMFVDVIDTTDMRGRYRVQVDECIRRDALRTEGRVGRGVIERMALDNGLVKFDSANRVIICDIDGTLANLDHRLHFVSGRSAGEQYDKVDKDWKSFLATVGNDGVFPCVRNIVMAARLSHMMLLVSGRATVIGHETAEWLKRKNIQYDHLFMRHADDFRPDHEVKEDILLALFDAGLQREQIKLVIDDRDSICDLWKRYELPLIKVDHDRPVEVSEHLSLHMWDYARGSARWITADNYASESLQVSLSKLIERESTNTV